MSHPGYLCYAGTEIVNNCRASVYAAAGWSRLKMTDCYCCDAAGMAAALDVIDDQNDPDPPDPSYTNPIADQAPWYSTTEPHSGDFGGVYVTAVEGLGPGPVTRELTDRASGGGSFLGRAKQTSAEVKVTAVLFGRTCCAAGYGLRWLRQVLLGPCGGADGCTGGDLLFLECCPDFDSAECQANPAACVQARQRLLKGVALTDAPKITRRLGARSGACTTGGNNCSGATALQVEFTLAAGRPCVYRDPVRVTPVAGTPISLVDTCVEWRPIGPAGCPDPCPTPGDCTLDPDCPPAIAAPKAPVLINNCYCDPLSTTRTCVDIDGDLVPRSATGVPIIELWTDAREIRGVNFSFYANPIDLDFQHLDPCSACGEVSVSRIPPWSRFRLDGLNRKVQVKCPGAAWTDASPLLGASGGRLPFRYPQIECGGVQHTLCVTVDGQTIAAGARLHVYMAVQEC